MGKGYKSFTEEHLIRLYGASAHPVRKVARPKKNGQGETIWFTKELESIQEAQVKCMTGEIYRYLIGPEQPKIRLKNANTVASENVNFYSLRDIFEDPKKRNSFNNFKSTFCENIEGFLMIVFSSIFLEENDLSSNNYGLITEGPKGHKRFGSSVKIDHGQSFNALRIQEEKHLAGKLDFKKNNLERAQIKYFPPIHPTPLMDRRTKNQRSTINIIGGGKRKYVITETFLNNIVTDFITGRIDKNYIKSLNFQPSVLPFYDGRLLSIIQAPNKKSRCNTMETSKYWALSKIIFTSLASYRFIADKAVQNDDKLQCYQDKIKKKIAKQQNTLREQMLNDPDWLLFCNYHGKQIEQRIIEAWNLIIFKKYSRGPSGRYCGGMMIRPIDYKALKQVVQLGREYRESKITERIDPFLRKLKNHIETKTWTTQLGRGSIIKVGNTRKKVPDKIASLYNQLCLYELCPTICLRMLSSITDIITLRSNNNNNCISCQNVYTEFYESLLSRMKGLVQDLTSPAVERIHPKLL
ncbi:MAG: hypothetical protein GY710_09750 [Desulfobacteraceae bacterium]|nr:hypothetical protein [Desulfobacteraceae bacterium]